MYTLTPKWMFTGKQPCEICKELKPWKGSDSQFPAKSLRCYTCMESDEAALSILRTFFPQEVAGKKIFPETYPETIEGRRHLRNAMHYLNDRFGFWDVVTQSEQEDWIMKRQIQLRMKPRERVMRLEWRPGFAADTYA